MTRCKKSTFIENYDAAAESAANSANPHYQKFADRKKALINHHYNGEIKKRLEALNTITIQKSAYDKGRYIADKVSELGASPYEISLAMAAKIGETTVSDLYIMHDQTVRSDHCSESPRGKIKTSTEMGKNLDYRIGWAHSHARFSRFFSSEDMQTLTKDAWKGPKIRLDLLDDEDSGDSLVVDVNIYQALVFNQSMSDTDMPYAGIMFSYVPFGSSQAQSHFYHNTSVNIIGEPSELDTATIDKHITERVILEGIGPIGDRAQPDTLTQRIERIENLFDRFFDLYQQTRR